VPAYWIIKFYRIAIPLFIKQIVILKKSFQQD